MSMTEFMTKDFLLKTETAKKLYHSYAASLPIIDYHCHINPKEILYDNYCFSSYFNRNHNDSLFSL